MTQKRSETVYIGNSCRWLNADQTVDLGRLMAARSNKIKSYYVPKKIFPIHAIYCILGAFNLRLYRFIYLYVQILIDSSVLIAFDPFWVGLGLFLVHFRLILIFRFGVVVSAEKWLVKIQKCIIPKFQNVWVLNGNFCPILIRSHILTR